ncbi:MAG: tRNA lysidine(34) synthetase TilS [Dehalococcoidia bacterium]
MTDELPRNRRTARFERRVARVLGARAHDGSTLVVACSGGPDSTAALVASARARGASGELVAAYFDHGMRPPQETEMDRAAVRRIAAQVGGRVVCGATEGGAPPASEAAAREARYEWLARVCTEAGARWCVTGHTLDDQAETVLLRLTRGSGLAGVAGMAVEAPWPVPAGPPAPRVLRPLLSVRRRAVMDYLDALGVEARFDTTNELLAFDRNRVRHRVLPELRAMNPQVEASLARFADLARRDDDALEAWARRALSAIGTHDQGGIALDRAALRALPPAVASRVLRQAAAALGVGADGGQIDAMLRLARRAGARLSLVGGQFVVERAAVRLRRLDEGEPAAD